MNVVALVSGGKDSLYSAMKCVEYGHRVTVLANLYPSNVEAQRDSYMYQTQGFEMLPAISECMGLPLERKEISGRATNQDLLYKPHLHQEADEVEDMFELLRQVKERYPSVTAVCSGAILSTYQRSRVENCCERLGLVSLAFLWQKEDQTRLLGEMIHHGVSAVLVKVCSYGLHPSHLGKTVEEMRPTFESLHSKLGMHVCGEGGEYETLTLDCPLFVRGSIVLDKSRAVVLEPIPDSPIAVLEILRFHIEPKIYIERSLSRLEVPHSARFNSQIWRREEVPTTRPKLWLDSYPKVDFPLLSTQLKSSLVVGPIDIPDLSSFEELFANALRAAGVRNRNQVCAVHLYLSNFKLDLEGVNQACDNFFRVERLPPTRVTLELPITQRLVVCALVSHQTQQRRLYSISRSEWAPHSLSRYSLGSVVDDTLVILSTQFPLVSATMELQDEGDIVSLLRTCVQHCHAVGTQLGAQETVAMVVYGSPEMGETPLEVIQNILKSLPYVPLLPPVILVVALSQLPLGARLGIEAVSSLFNGKVVASVVAPLQGDNSSLWARTFVNCAIPMPKLSGVIIPVLAVTLVVDGRQQGNEEFASLRLFVEETEDSDSE